MGNIILGAVALALAEGILSRSGATARVGGLVAGLGKAVEWFLSPTVPAFRGAKASTSSTSLAVLSAASSAPSSAPPTPPATPASFGGLSPIFPGQSPQTVAQGGAV